MRSQGSATTTWTNSFGCVLITSGATLGLWQFLDIPYYIGTYGSSFLWVYFLALTLFALPLVMAEVAIGRYADTNPITAVAKLARGSDLSRQWSFVGGIHWFTALVVMAVALPAVGIHLHKLYLYSSKSLFAISKADISAAAHAWEIWSWQSLLIAVATLMAFVSPRNRFAIKMRQALTVLVVLLFIGILAKLFFVGGLSRPFAPYQGPIMKPDYLMVKAAILKALLSLVVGFSFVMAYSTYLPKKTSVPVHGLSLLLVNGLVSLLAAYLIVHDPMLLFKGYRPTYEWVYSNLDWLGENLHLIYYFSAAILCAFIASLLAVMESPTAWLVERFAWPRYAAVLASALIIWLVSSSLTWLIYTQSLEGVAEAIQFFTLTLLVPFSALLLSLLVGWKLKRTEIRKALNFTKLWQFNLWRALCRVFIPLALLFCIGLSAYQFYFS